MSLISEGLKKAHMEAMQQDRAQRQAYLRSAGPHVPPRSSSPFAQTIAIALGSAVLASAAVLWLRGSSPRSEAPAVSQQAETAGVQRAADVPPTPKSAVAVGAVRPPSRAEPEQQASASPAARRPRKRSVPGEETVIATRREAPPEAVQASGPRRRDRFTEGLTYASPIQGVGGTELVLSGIVGRAGESLAIINGRTMRPGVMIGPFVIERIEPRRVALRYIDIRFYLTP